MKIAIPKLVTVPYEVVKPGIHLGICCAIVDNGTQVGSFGGRPTIGRKVQITFELPQVGNSQTGNPLKVSQLYTVSLHPKAKLRKDIESWMEKPMAPQDIDSFEFTWMLGRHCRLEVGQNVKGENVYATVERILPVPSDTAVPKAVNDPVFFSLDEPDLKVFATLSSSAKAIIQASPEWKLLPFADNWLKQYNAVIAANDAPF